MPANREDELRRLYEAEGHEAWETARTSMTGEALLQFWVAGEKWPARSVQLPKETVALIVATHNALPRLLAVVAAAREGASVAPGSAGDLILREKVRAALAALDAGKEE